MRKRMSFLIFIFVILFSFCGTSIAAYIINDFTIGSFNEGIAEVDNNYAKVVFDGGNLGIEDKTMYVEKGKTVSLVDAPKYTASNGYIIWTDQKGQKLSLNEGFENYVYINSDTTFTASIYSEIADTSANGLFDFTSNNYQGSSYFNGKEVYIDENGSGANNLPDNYGEFNKNVSVIKNLNINMRVKINGELAVNPDLFSENDIDENNDGTIGLEDNTDKNASYRPSGGDKNYCRNRIKLSNDLLFINSNLNVGAWVGFFGDGGNPGDRFYQINYQGFIIGGYSEIDLCGHYLVIGANSKLWLLGSIVNSVPDKGGLIIEDGGSLESHFVVEDHHHETSLPCTYEYGDAAFAMYRSPYLNVNSIFSANSNIIFALNIWFGKSQGGIYRKINLIGGEKSGDSTDPIIQVNSHENGYIKRYVYFDEGMQNYIDAKSPNSISYEEQNIMTQKIRYEIHNINFSLNLAEFTVKFSSEFTVDLGKNNFYIPPYFNFYLYNCNCTFYDSLVFMVGSYLFVDENSTLTFSAKGFQYIDEIGSSIAQSLGLGPHFEEQAYQEVAGLIFVQERYDYTEAVKKWIDDADALGGSRGGSTAYIYYSSTNFRKYLNHNCKSSCDMLGKFAFDNDVNKSRNYHLGGNINIDNYKNFYETVSSRNDINFYCSTFKSGASHIYKGKVGIVSAAVNNTDSLNVSDYYSLPLITNGFVAMQPNNPTQVFQYPNNNGYIYDSTKGIIYSQIEKKKYAYFFVRNNTLDMSVDHLNKAFYKSESDLRNGYDSLEGKYLEINYNDTNKVVSIRNGELSGNFVFFHGMFVPINIASSNATVGTINLSKFRTSDLTFNGSMGSRGATFVKSASNGSTYNNYDTWRLS